MTQSSFRVLNVMFPQQLGEGQPWSGGHSKPDKRPPKELKLKDTGSTSPARGRLSLNYCRFDNPRTGTPALILLPVGGTCIQHESGVWLPSLSNSMSREMTWTLQKLNILEEKYTFELIEKFIFLGFFFFWLFVSVSVGMCIDFSVFVLLFLFSSFPPFLTIILELREFPSSFFLISFFFFFFL